VLIVVRRKSQRLEHVRRTRDVVADLCASSKDQFGLLIVYEGGAELPDRECRRATAAVLTEFGSRLACAATVIEGDGIRPAMLRLVFRSLGSLLESSLRRFICAHVDEGAAWVASVLGPGVDPQALGSVVAGLRAGPASALAQPVQG
jgi:hypothetical protein